MSVNGSNRAIRSSMLLRTIAAQVILGGVLLVASGCASQADEADDNNSALSSPNKSLTLRATNDASSSLFGRVASVEIAADPWPLHTYLYAVERGEATNNHHLWLSMTPIKPTGGRVDESSGEHADFSPEDGLMFDLKMDVKWAEAKFYRESDGDGEISLWGATETTGPNGEVKEKEFAKIIHYTMNQQTPGWGDTFKQPITLTPSITLVEQLYGAVVPGVPKIETTPTTDAAAKSMGALVELLSENSGDGATTARVLRKSLGIAHRLETSNLFVSFSTNNNKDGKPSSRVFDLGPSKLGLGVDVLSSLKWVSDNELTFEALERVGSSPSKNFRYKLSFQRGVDGAPSDVLTVTRNECSDTGCE